LFLANGQITETGKKILLIIKFIVEKQVFTLVKKLKLKLFRLEIL